jgi:ribosomal-protein-alanine N-acetyltransferase
MTAADPRRLAEIDALSNRAPWTEAQFARELDLPFSFQIVAAHGSLVVGFAVGWALGEVAQLLQIAVDPAYRRAGVGSWILGRAVEEARSRGCRRLELEFRAGNAAARGMYGRAGFRQAGLRRRFYESSEDAVLMDLDL